MALTVGTVEIEIFARWNGTEHPIGTVEVPLKINRSATLRNVRAALTDDEDPAPSEDPVPGPSAADLHARVHTGDKP